VDPCNTVTGIYLSRGFWELPVYPCLLGMREDILCTRLWRFEVFAEVFFFISCMRIDAFEIGGEMTLFGTCISSPCRSEELQNISEVSFLYFV
jgi:hypothetical protein